MELIINIANLWNEFLVGSLISCGLVYAFVAISTLFTKNNYRTTATITALVAVICGDVFRITLKVGLFLSLMRLGINFI